MNYKSHLPFLILTIFCLKGHSQNYNYLYPYAGIEFQKHVGGDIGICYGDGDPNGGSCSGSSTVFSIKAGTELTFDNNKLVLGPKVSAEFDAFHWLGARINVVDYTDFKTNGYCILPELGFSLGGLFDIFYGYNIQLTTEKLGWVSPNQLTLVFNFSLWPKREGGDKF